jgi:hypothetical protein
MTTRARVAMVCAFAMLAVSRVDAQQRDALRRGHAAYDLADNAAAIPLLSRGLDPASGPRDSLWVAAVHKLIDALLSQADDSLAATWARWAHRQGNSFPVDGVNFSPAVVDVLQEARRTVDRTRIPRGVTIVWKWEGAGAAGGGQVLIARTGIAINARIGNGDFVTSGVATPVRAGSHQMLATAEGFLPERAPIEILPGVTTQVTFQLAPAAAGVVTIRSYPWAQVAIDTRPAGWSALLQRTTPGSHRISITRDGYRPFDTTIVVHKDDTARIAVTLRRLDGSTPPEPRPQWMLASALDSADIAGTIQRVREQLASSPPRRRRRHRSAPGSTGASVSRTSHSA